MTKKREEIVFNLELGMNIDLYWKCVESYPNLDVRLSISAERVRAMMPKPLTVEDIVRHNLSPEQVKWREDMVNKELAFGIIERYNHNLPQDQIEMKEKLDKIMNLNLKRYWENLRMKLDANEAFDLDSAMSIIAEANRDNSQNWSNSDGTDAAKHMLEMVDKFKRENPPLPTATPEQQMHAVRRQIQSGNRISWREILKSQGLSPIDDEIRIAPHSVITEKNEKEEKDNENTLRVSGLGVTRPPVTKINLTGE